MLQNTQVDTVYLLVRGKRHATPAQRVQKLLCDPLFHVLHKQTAAGGPNVFNKVRAVAGDLCAPGLGLSAADAQELKESVDFVIHCAANVTLDADVQATFRYGSKLYCACPGYPVAGSNAAGKHSLIPALVTPAGASLKLVDSAASTWSVTAPAEVYTMCQCSQQAEFNSRQMTHSWHVNHCHHCHTAQVQPRHYTLSCMLPTELVHAISTTASCCSQSYKLDSHTAACLQTQGQLHQHTSTHGSVLPDDKPRSIRPYLDLLCQQPPTPQQLGHGEDIPTGSTARWQIYHT